MTQVNNPQRQVGQLSPHQQKQLEEDEVFLCSISPWPAYNANTQGIQMELPANPQGQGYIMVPIKGYVAYKGFGHEQFEPLLVTAREHAEDLAGRIGPFRGVFFPADGEPTPEELAACRERFEKYLREVYSDAVKLWGRSKNPVNIGDHARFAAAYFGLTPEWGGSIESVRDCPACKKKVDPAAVRCGTCRYVMEWQKAYDMGALLSDEVETGVDRGFIIPAKQKAG